MSYRNFTITQETLNQIMLDGGGTVDAGRGTLIDTSTLPGYMVGVTMIDIIQDVHRIAAEPDDLMFLTTGWRIPAWADLVKVMTHPDQTHTGYDRLHRIFQDSLVGDLSARVYAGFWVERGWLFIDASVNVKTLEDAEFLARYIGQQAIWDNQNQTDITIVYDE